MNAPRVNLHGLDSASWSRINLILDQVLDLSSTELTPALARLCAGDAALEAQIRTILAADLAVEGILTRAGRQGLLREEADLEAGFPAMEGRTLGPWRVLRPIGRGGMGAVYLGERADGAFEQRVAIKLLGRGIASPDLLARFRQERQILARLEHPNIARLVDGGVTHDGLWWFAMEYVDGAPITEWRATHAVPPRALLERFQQVCRAVQYAHRNLVVHRDLKPSNIMVSESGEVKLLDFGIAKILEPDPGPGGADPSGARLGAGPGLAPPGVSRAADALTTAAMTPSYAAPEQIRGEPATTATDVYALGVVLYELLAGERPYRARTGTFEEARRAVLEEDPEPPSARVRRLRRERASEPPAAGGTPLDSREVERPHGALTDVSRELDAIVLTALRKEPDRRYPSVEALSEDLQRHLDGRAVRASGRDFRYLAGKFVRRNRVPLAATGAVLLALLAGLHATARERDRARQEAARAGELKEFALNLFRGSNPEEGNAPDVTARELLDRGAVRVDRELRDPRLQAEMWDMLGSVYRSLDLFPQAVVVHRKAVAARRAHPDRPDTLLSASLRLLGSALNENGEYDEAVRTLREALAIERRNFGEVHPRVALALGELTILRSRMGYTAEAESLYHEVIRIDSLTIGLDNKDAATDIANLGMLYYDDGRYREAVPYIARALEIRRRAKDPLLVDLPTGVDQMGLVLFAAGDVDSGLVYMRQALAMRRRWLRADHPDIAHSLMNLGSALSSVGQLDESVADLREALALRRRALSPRDPLLAHNHNELGIVFYRQRQLDSAAVHFQEAIRIWAYALPLDHSDVLTTRSNLGVVYREMGRYADSEKTLREVLALRLRTLRPDHLDVAVTEYHLGRLLVMTRRSSEGIPHLRHAEEARLAALDADDPRVAEVRITLGNAMYSIGQRREGLALIRANLEHAETRLGANDRMVMLSKWRLAKGAVGSKI